MEESSLSGSSEGGEREWTDGMKKRKWSVSCEEGIDEMSERVNARMRECVNCRERGASGSARERQGEHITNHESRINQS